MKRIAEAFARGKAFIPYVTCGDPDLATTEAAVRTLAANGADLIELGIPFSDPTAEGPVIQEASRRALAGGVTAEAVLDMVRRLRRDVDVPLLLMTYANVVFSRGTAAFTAAAADAGADGFILPDVPFEEQAEFAGPCRDCGLAFISLIAPTSGERIGPIARAARGFLYCVSSLGVTGVRGQLGGGVAAMVAAAKAANPDLPCAVGFGIATPEQAARAAAAADGAIVGSAIVRMLTEKGRDALPELAAYARTMKAAVTAAGASAGTPSAPA